MLTAFYEFYGVPAEGHAQDSGDQLPSPYEPDRSELRTGFEPAIKSLAVGLFSFASFTGLRGRPSTPHFPDSQQGEHKYPYSLSA